MIGLASDPTPEDVEDVPIKVRDCVGSSPITVIISLDPGCFINVGFTVYVSVPAVTGDPGIV